MRSFVEISFMFSICDISFKIKLKIRDFHAHITRLCAIVFINGKTISILHNVVGMGMSYNIIILSDVVGVTLLIAIAICDKILFRRFKTKQIFLLRSKFWYFHILERSEVELELFVRMFLMNLLSTILPCIPLKIFLE